LAEHSRIGREMVLVASSEKPLVKASKETLIRAVTEKLYEQR
jgi:hypothetical protein